MSEKSKVEIEFPCEFPIKIMGKSNNEFELAVYSIIRKHVPDLAQNAISQRPSKNGNYMAITVTITAQNQDQLDNIYFDLTACEHVMMAL
ncbi:MAG: DUF493 domain-containing protein [Pseudomonadota bacterium]